MSYNAHIGLVIPTLSNFKGLAELLVSVQTLYPWEPCVVPNWKDNIGVSKSWNYGIQDLRWCDYIFVINDDVILQPETLNLMIDAYREHDMHILNPRNTRDDEPSEGLAEHCDFSCFMLTYEVFKKIGTFDENFFPAYFEDNDYYYRAKLLGLKVGTAKWIPFFHSGSITQFMDQKNPVVPGQLFEANRAYYISKWGGEPGHEVFLTPYNDPNMTPKDWYNTKTEGLSMSE